jgi:EPS-associated MarR family transcriptional regulator
MNGAFMEQEELTVKILHAVEQNPELSQRDLSNQIGISLGKTNYVLKSLIKKGFIKTESFLNSRNKWAYRYNLTPKGMKEKAIITKNFIKRKMEEYERLLGE